MAMKIVRFNCCGMDVHKNLVVATIGITDRKTNVTEYFQRSFSTLNSDLYRLKDWLRSHHCSDVCMESTGKYWIPIFNILEDEINVHLTHPKYVKAIKGKKTDKKDSKWICDLFKHDLIKFSFIPPKEIRELREIARYRYKLVCMRSSERNRYQNCMTVSNVGLASVVSDPFGKTASNIMKEVMKSNVIDDDKILKLVHKNCKNKDKILDSLHGYRIESDQRFKMEKSLDHMEYLDQLIDSCEVELIKRAYPFRRSFQHITQIKGISALSAILIISEILLQRMIVRKFPLFSAFQIADLPTGSVQLIPRRITAAIFGVPCVGSQKPFAADFAFLRRMADTQALKEIRSEHPNKGNIVDSFDQLCNFFAGTDDRYILNRIVQGRHPGIALCDRQLWREIAAEHSGEALCGAVCFVTV